MTYPEQRLDKAHSEAAYWIGVLYDDTDIDPLLPKFRAWLDAAPENRPAYWDMRKSWDQLAVLEGEAACDLNDIDAEQALPVEQVALVDQAAPVQQTVPVEPALAPAPIRRRARVWPPAVGIAGLAVAAVGVAAMVLTHFDLSFWRPQCTTPSVLHPGECKLSTGQHASPVDQASKLELIDGTDITLQADSEVSLNLGENHRLVQLVRGEALFDVAKKYKAPFVVTVGSFNVRAVGTAFSIRKTRGADSAQTVVRDGEVEVVGPKGQHYLVRANEVAEFNGGLISVHPLAMSTVIFKSSPETGATLMFRGAPLSEAARVFNWYKGCQLVVDADLADLRIGGQFSATQPKEFVAALEKMYSIVRTVTVDPATGKETIRLRKRRPSNDTPLANQQSHLPAK